MSALDPSQSPDSGEASIGAVADRLPRFLAQLHAFVRLRASPMLLAHESSRDLTQSICREALKSNKRAAFANDAQFAKWLCSLAVRKLVSRRRMIQAQKRAGNRQPVQLREEDERSIAAAYASIHSPCEAVALRESVARLEHAMAQLSPDHLEVVTLAQIMQIPRREVGEIMGRSEVAVRQLLARALAQLGALLSRRELHQGQASPASSPASRSAPDDASSDAS